MKKNKHVLKRHYFMHWLYRVLSFLITRTLWGYRCKSKYKIKKGETILVLSNHQTDIDPMFVCSCFNKPVYPVGTESLFHSKFTSHFFGKTIGVIPKRKGASDLKASVAMLRTVQEGGSLLLYPEGNRTYAEFQYHITPAFSKFIKTLKCTLVLFRLEGGTGTRPRFANKPRKGKFSGKITQVLKFDEYKDMPDEELLKFIYDNIRSYDSESGNLYKSNKKAEYLERMFFVCPKCGAMHTLHSKGDHFTCSACGLDMTYGEDLHLHSDDPSFKYNRLLDYWNYQKRVIKHMEIKPGEVIFKDEDCELYLNNPYEKRQLLYKGEMALTDTEFIFGDIRLPIKNLVTCSTISGTKLYITIEKTCYLIKGHIRFNPLKYNFVLNRLDTEMANRHLDEYYNLEEN